MTGTTAEIWTVEKFETETNPEKPRRKLADVDAALRAWAAAKGGRSTELRVRTLRSLAAACTAYLIAQKGKKDRKERGFFGAPSARLLNRIAKTETLAGQVFRRLASELYAYNKVVRADMPGTRLGRAQRTGLRPGYRHELQLFLDFKRLGGLQGVASDQGGEINVPGGSFVHVEQDAARNPGFLAAWDLTLPPRIAVLVAKPFGQLSLGEFRELHAFFAQNTIMGTQTQRVHLARKDERQREFLKIALDGLLYDSGGNLHGTGALEAYALDRYGNLLTSNASRNWGSGKAGDMAGNFQLNHSTLTGANAVICAGTIKIDRGAVTYISNNSGHYRPSPQQLSNAISVLAEEYDLPLGQTVTEIEELSAEARYDSVAQFQGQHPPQ